MATLTPEELKGKIEASAKQCLREETRKKIDLFLKAIQFGNVLKACREFKKATSFYYYWWNRYRESDFRLEALEEKSRRPKAHPRQFDRQVVEWIKRYR